MNFSIAFRNLPFTPVNSQVIYVEDEFSDSCNLYIRQNFHSIESHYKRLNKEFVYLPYITLFQNIEERVRYYAPYLKSDIVFPELPKSDTLLQYMANPDNRSQIKPSIIWFNSQEGDEYIFNGITIETNDDFYWQFGNDRTMTSHPNAVCYRTRDDDEISLCQDARFDERRVHDDISSKAREEIYLEEDEQAIRRAEEEARKKAEQERIRKENSLSAKLRRGMRSFYRKMEADEEVGGSDSVCYSTRNYDEECHRPPVVTEELTPYTDDIDVEDTIRDLERTVARLQL